MNQYDKLKKENEELRKACAQHKADNLSLDIVAKNLEQVIQQERLENSTLRRQHMERSGEIKGLERALEIVMRSHE